MSNEHKVEVITAKIKALLEADPQKSGVWLEHQAFAIEFAERIPLRAQREWGPTATMYTPYNDCERFVAYKVRQTPADQPLGWRAFNTFAMGHMIEMWLKSLMVECGYTFSTHVSAKLRWNLPEYGQVYVGPDGAHLDIDTTEVLGYQAKHVILEFKSASFRSFDKMEAIGVFNARHSYYEQCQLGMEGLKADLCILIVQCKNTGRLLEIWIERDQAEIDSLDARFIYVHTHKPEAIDRPHATVAVRKYHKGKADPRERDPCPMEDPANAVSENRSKRGALVGWYETIGHQLNWQCGYCDYHQACWGNHITHTTYDGNKPIIWVDLEIQHSENNDDNSELDNSE